MRWEKRLCLQKVCKASRSACLALATVPSGAVLPVVIVPRPRDTLRFLRRLRVTSLIMLRIHDIKPTTPSTSELYSQRSGPRTIPGSLSAASALQGNWAPEGLGSGLAGRASRRSSERLRRPQRRRNRRARDALLPACYLAGSKRWQTLRTVLPLRHPDDDRLVAELLEMKCTKWLHLSCKSETLSENKNEVA